MKGHVHSKEILKHLVHEMLVIARSRIKEVGYVNAFFTADEDIAHEAFIIGFTGVYNDKIVKRDCVLTYEMFYYETVTKTGNQLSFRINFFVDQIINHAFKYANGYNTESTNDVI